MMHCANANDDGPVQLTDGKTDPHIDVVLDCGDEHVVRIQRESARSAKTLRASIAKAAVKQLGRRAPKAWLMANGNVAALSKSMSVTVCCDNQLDEPNSVLLRNDTPASCIRQATSILVLPT